ncbi:sensor histidine kinase [Streptomyces johnsoniae]|uniref:histidine kinase n=1 Tax=Streptomyces johnsoniae TaxID=3075532 RepID=A0ABU2S8N6_9ACTN|nr:histidine kinase [Streptomyces sp. DSM 41886]MDT0445341.1 histidine kinase [Streptomyces sp. DSM 41886]
MVGRQLVILLRSPWRRAIPQDMALAGGLLVMCLLVNDPGAAVRDTVYGPLAEVLDGPTPWLWWTATAGVTVAVTLRRRWPSAMLAVATLATATHVALAVRPMIIDSGALVLLYTVAAHRRRAVSAAALAVMVALVTAWSICHAFHGRLAAGLPSTVIRYGAPADGGGGGGGGGGEVSVSDRDSSSSAWLTALVYGSALVVAWSTGSAARNRRAYQEQLRTRARDLERERDQRAALAVAAERARISREMHDVVAHGLSVIVIQAQGAAAALHDAPAESEAALDAIVGIGRDSLADMRRVLAAVGETDGNWHPPPGLSQLESLLATVERAGTPVRLRVRGDPSALPAAVDLSAYRIVQEALTNTIKHAGEGATADVTVSYGRGEVSVEVRDDGRAAPSIVSEDGGGNGLHGMRERVRLLNGRFSAEACPGGGYVVRAALPLHRSEREAGPGASSAHRLTGGSP